jgi:enterochelin esterase-like enzyme
MPIAAVAMALALQATSIRTTGELESALRNLNAPGVKESIYGYIDMKTLDKGIWPRIDDRKVALGIKANGAKEVEARLVPGGPSQKLKSVGQDAFVGIFDLKYEDAYQIEYYADGKRIGDGRTVEIYKMPEEMRTNPNVAKGELRSMPKQESKIYPGTTSEWWAYKPAKPEPEGGYGLIVFQDGQWAKNYAVPCLDNMIAKGDLPPVVAVFIKPSDHKDGYSIRWRQYDVLSDEYVRFVTEEYEPVVAQTLGVKISSSPQKRCIAGLSSGGICAFTAAWQKPEKFGLVMSWIGSFVNIASGDSKREGGHNYPALIRKTPNKPIRVFLQDGDQDLDNEHGNWFLSNLQMVNSLKYKAYDYKWVPGHGFHSDAQGKAVMPEALRYLFGTEKK